MSNFNLENGQKAWAHVSLGSEMIWLPVVLMQVRYTMCLVRYSIARNDEWVVTPRIFTEEEYAIKVLAV